MYKGIEITNLDNYIFDTIPYNEQIDLNKVRQIESKLREYTSGYTQDGISYDDAFKFLDWITFNARSYATSNIPESAMSAPLTGTCGPTQSLNVTLLKKIGLYVKPFNMGECVGTTPMSEMDTQRIKNGFLSTNTRHAVALVNLPINHNGKTEIRSYLLDPTFRQFCLKENCNKDLYFDKERINKGLVAPHPGYFLSEKYLKEKGSDNEKIKSSDYIARILINRGYMELTEENAKIYCDAFAMSGVRWEYRNVDLHMSGKDYINEIRNSSVEIHMPHDDKFTKTPMEIEEKKTVLDRIKDFIMRIKQTNKRKYLPSPEISNNDMRKQFLGKYKYSDYKYSNEKQNSIKRVYGKDDFSR